MKMRRGFLKSLLAILSLGWLTGSSRGSNLINTENTATTQDKADPVWLAFELSDLIEKQSNRTRPYLKFIDVSTLSMGLYSLPAGGVDKQKPHKEDEIYVISEGRAVLDVEGESFPAKPGSIFFVKAHAKHHFHDFEEDLKVLVLFSRKKPF